MTVHYQRIPSTDPRLNRHIRHDDRSRQYAFDTTGLSIVSAKHTRRIPVLDQGQLGSCTGNAGIGCLGTDPFYDTLAVPTIIKAKGRALSMADADRIKDAYEAAASTGRPLVISEDMEIRPRRAVRYQLNEYGAVALYSDATKADDYPGQYPPTDTGSDGLTIAKVLKAAGEISGYTHTFTLDDALKALGVTPVITGVNWYSNMFDPDTDGRVYPTGDIAGGHEFVVDEIDATNQRVWFTNSWGESWGLNGRAYLTFGDWGDLLGQQGDVTIFTPLTQPAPTPPGDPDSVLAAAFRHDNWVTHHHVGDNAHVAHAAAAWLRAKNL